MGNALKVINSKPFKCLVTAISLATLIGCSSPKKAPSRTDYANNPIVISISHRLSQLEDRNSDGRIDVCRIPNGFAGFDLTLYDPNTLSRPKGFIQPLSKEQIRLLNQIDSLTAEFVYKMDSINYYSKYKKLN
jgi:hypothetical protein